MPIVIALDCKNIMEIITEAVRVGMTPDIIETLVPKALFRAIRVEGVEKDSADRMLKEIDGFGGIGIAGPQGDGPRDVLLFGTYRQYQCLIASLADGNDELLRTAFGLRDALLRTEDSAPPAPLHTGRGALVFGKKTLIMGILNTTPDSFYDGGRRAGADAAIEHGSRLVTEGADILDVGGESTRPGAEAVPADEEISRVVPVIEALRARHPNTPISIDTMKAPVAEAALDAGADIVNDVTAMRADPDMAALCAKRNASVCLMHMKGMPADMQRDPQYPRDVCFEIIAFLAERVRYAMEAGIPEENIMVDPGIGFGKTRDHNLELLNRLAEFRSLGRPIVVGASRKRFIGELTKTEPEDRLEGSLAAAGIAAAKGAHVIRVHDVDATRKALAVADAILHHQRMSPKHGS